MPKFSTDKNGQLTLSENQFFTKVTIDNLFTIKDFKVTNENNIINYHITFSDSSFLDVTLNHNDGKWRYSGKALSQRFNDDPDVENGVILTIMGGSKKDSD